MPKQQSIEEFAKQVEQQLVEEYAIPTENFEGMTALHGQEKAKFEINDFELWFRYAPDGGVVIDQMGENKNLDTIVVEPPI